MNIYIQQDSKDCGPVCLMNIAGFYGKSYPMHLLREYCNMTKDGVSLKGLASAANRMGFVTTTAKIDMRQLKDEIKLPCILLFGNNHFVVFYKISRNKRCFKLIDPALGKISYSEKEMAERWALLPSEAQWHGVAMQLEPSGAWDPNVQNSEEQVRVVKTFLSYIYPHKMALLLILLGTIVTMCHHEYAVFKLAKDGKPAVREEQDNFYGHPYGSGLDEDAGATYREIDALMRYYKIAIPGINGGYEHVVESKTTKYYKL